MAVAASTGDLRPLKASGIELVVFDMAGTTVDEGGLVYLTLQRVLRGHGLAFTEDEFNAFHGANKREVIAYAPRSPDPR